MKVAMLTQHGRRMWVIIPQNITAFSWKLVWNAVAELQSDLGLVVVFLRGLQTDFCPGSIKKKFTCNKVQLEASEQIYAFF